MNNIIEKYITHQPLAWLPPVVSLLVTLSGVLFFGWSTQPIVVVFWWEVVLMVGTALLRVLFALDGRPVMDLLFQKIGLLVGGAIMGGAFVMFSVVFTFGAMDIEHTNGWGDMSHQIRTVQVGYLLGLVLHYFVNGRYQTANPTGELLTTLIHLLFLMAPLMAITMHLLPKFPQLNQAKWVCVAVVVLKFLVDMLFAKLGAEIVRSGFSRQA
jgi:hypothetical protein